MSLEKQLEKTNELLSKIIELLGTASATTTPCAQTRTETQEVIEKEKTAKKAKVRPQAEAPAPAPAPVQEELFPITPETPPSTPQEDITYDKVRDVTLEFMKKKLDAGENGRDALLLILKDFGGITSAKQLKSEQFAKYYARMQSELH